MYIYIIYKVYRFVPHVYMCVYIYIYIYICSSLSLSLRPFESVLRSHA